MGTQQTEAELDLWMWNTLVATAGYQDTWTTELMELLKLCLVVSDWDRNSPAAVGFAYLHHYLVRTHARPESALAAAAAAALEAATARANSTAPVDVAEQLLSLEMDTVIGSLAFDALRQRRAGSSLVQLMHYRNPPNMPMAGGTCVSRLRGSVHMARPLLLLDGAAHAWAARYAAVSPDHVAGALLPERGAGALRRLGLWPPGPYYLLYL